MLQLECFKCGSEYEPTQADTTLFLFEEKEYNFLETQCRACKAPFVLFFDNPELLTLGYEAKYAKSPPDHVKAAYHEVMAAEEVELLHELSPRQEALVQSLHAALEVTPDDVLLDMFASPPPPSNLPRRWV